MPELPKHKWQKYIAIVYADKMRPAGTGGIMSG
jgi:hypothetical protein